MKYVFLFVLMQIFQIQLALCECNLAIFKPSRAAQDADMAFIGVASQVSDGEAEEVFEKTLFNFAGYKLTRDASMSFPVKRASFQITKNLKRVGLNRYLKKVIILTRVGSVDDEFEMKEGKTYEIYANTRGPGIKTPENAYWVSSCSESRELR